LARPPGKAGEKEQFMGAFSIWHILALAIIVLLLFGGRGKISDLMGDFAKGIKSFKKNMADEPDASMEATAVERPTGNIAGPAHTTGTTTTTRETTTARPV
jgi:sec-independent protein translocase protein TatA